ncbi:MAG: 50S ribosomal protein L13 [Candidatus Nitrosopolaris sp.]
MAEQQELKKTERVSLKPERGELVVDGAGCIAGRLCSNVSKLILKGNRVTIVNAEKAMLSGDRYKTIQLYKEHLEINSATNPIHGPFHPRRPDRILTKMVRGMIPKRKASGIEAFKRLRVYVSIPDQLKNSSMKSFEDSKITKPMSYYITIGDLAKEIGWSGEIHGG